MTKGQAAYELRCSSTLTWAQIGRRLEMRAPAETARHYALYAGKPWPARPPKTRNRTRKVRAREVAYTCDHCGGMATGTSSKVNRARRGGFKLYCDRECWRAARCGKRDLGAEQERKRAYDAEYRAKHVEWIKAQKREHYRANAKAIYQQQREARLADPERMARYRAGQKRCQSTSEWKAHKRAYDRERNSRAYGEMAEAWLALRELEDAIREKAEKLALMQTKNTHNRREQKKRAARRAACQTSTQ